MSFPTHYIKNELYYITTSHDKSAKSTHRTFIGLDCDPLKIETLTGLASNHIYQVEFTKKNN